jgi:cytochrome c5
MKKLLLVLLVGIISASCSKKATPTASSTTAVPPTPKAVPLTEEAGVPPALLAKPGSDEIVLQGKEIYTAKCGRCHDLPVAARYMSQRWAHIMDEMAPKAKLSDSEKSMVLMYVQANAKK